MPEPERTSPPEAPPPQPAPEDLPDPSGNGVTLEAAATTPPVSPAVAADMESTDEAFEEPLPFVFDPLAPYKGAFRRFFTVYRHTIGLLIGGLVAYVRALPPERTRGLRSAGTRLAAFLLKPFAQREIRELPFPKQLRRRLEILGPTFVKLGQVLAIREDLLPPSVTDELSNLFDRVPEIPFEEVRRIIERDLEQPLDALFADVDPEPLGSASIAQAHRATLTDGTAAVVKVIKPGIRDVITSDLTLLDLVARFLQWLIPRYQPKQVADEFAAYTRREVDYTYEADNAEIFTVNFADEPGIVFPEIYRDRSSENVLTMEFLDGYKPGSDAMDTLNEAERARVIDLGAQAIIRMLYEHGFFHADLHAGNLLILPGEGPEQPVRVGFIDLGMVGRFERKTKRRMMYYFYALVTEDVESAARYLVSMAKVGEGGDPEGFRRAVTDLARRFVMHARSGDLSIASLILESVGLGGRYRIFFPVEMTLMVKALVTYEGVGRRLAPELNVTDVSRKHVSRIFRDHFNPTAISRELLRSAPEMADLLVQMPQLLSSGVKFLEEQMNDTSRDHPLAGLRSSIIAAGCLVGGVIAVVQGGPILLWVILFVAGGLLSLFGGK
ncbi:MAG: AarF/ABC1/UbiB kinase family protein [Bacteroidetes bacterium]|jgi:ubiquinone biosynthesis protein|nr:AarF/ABC1/UbiB kinase family protein [Bacteroidota bacterium]